MNFMDLQNQLKNVKVFFKLIYLVGKDIRFYGDHIDYLRLEILLHEFNDKNCTIGPYGKINGVYKLSSPGVNCDKDWMVNLQLLNLTFTPLNNNAFQFKMWCRNYNIYGNNTFNVFKCEKFPFDKLRIQFMYFCHQRFNSSEKTLYYYCKEDKQGYHEFPPALFLAKEIISINLFYLYRI